MEIILLKDVDTLGYRYDIVDVKNGYGRNYLIPQKLAVLANEDNRRQRDRIVDRMEAAKERRIDEFKAIATQLAPVVLKIGAKAGTSGKIFGSVTNIQIMQALKEQLNIDIERRAIIMPEEVKNLGSYTAIANLHKSVQANINFEVVAD